MTLSWRGSKRRGPGEETPRAFSPLMTQRRLMGQESHGRQRSNVAAAFRRQGSDALEPKAPGEDDYSFYDSAARPEYDIYRALLNGWMKEMSEPGQKEPLPRFRKNESLEYQTALAELTTHAALKSQGYAVDVHPKSDQTDRKPDFLARDAKGESAAYVEVTTFGPSKDFTGKHKRGRYL
jgi:hypothetical protein